MGDRAFPVFYGGNMEEEVQRIEIVKIIQELRQKGWSDTEIIEFLLKVASN